MIYYCFQSKEELYRAVLKSCYARFRQIEASLDLDALPPRAALCFYNVSNRYTFSQVFKRDLAAPAVAAARREEVADIIDRWCAVTR